MRQQLPDFCWKWPPSAKMSYMRRTTILWRWCNRTVVRFSIVVFTSYSFRRLFLYPSDTTAKTIVRKSRIREENAISINLDRRTMGRWYPRCMGRRRVVVLEVKGVFHRQENNRSTILNRRRAVISQFYSRSLAISRFESFIATWREVSQQVYYHV